jgi:hypothetical protein
MREAEQGFFVALSDLTETLEGVVESTKDVELATIRGQLMSKKDTLGDILARPSAEIEDPRITAAQKIGELTCSRCTGPVVDPETGLAYCGRSVPNEVLAKIPE